MIANVLKRQGTKKRMINETDLMRLIDYLNNCSEDHNNCKVHNAFVFMLEYLMKFTKITPSFAKGCDSGNTHRGSKSF